MSKKYRVIYADPAWPFETYSEKGKDRSPEKHYQTMTLEDIYNLDVQSITDPSGAVCILWVTYPLLIEGIQTLQQWGFTYKTVAFTWGKTTRRALKPSFFFNVFDPRNWFMGNGYYTRANPEIALLGTVGKPDRPAVRNVRNLQIHPFTRHSEKPAAIRSDIEKMYPDADRVELFARQRAVGWDSIGNEIDGQDIRGVLGMRNQAQFSADFSSGVQ